MDRGLWTVDSGPWTASRLKTQDSRLDTASDKIAPQIEEMICEELIRPILEAQNAKPPQPPALPAPPRPAVGVGANPSAAAYRDDDLPPAHVTVDGHSA
jgi:hypothetical protein